MKTIQLHSDRFGRQLVRIKKKQIIKTAKSKHENFHESIEFIIRVAQYFTLLPVAGLQSHDLNDLTYSTISFRTIAAIIFILLGIIEIGLAFNHAIQFNFHFTSVSNLIFIIEGTFGAVFLLLLARRWKYFMIQWRILENCFLYEPYEMDGLNLKTKIRRTGSVYILLGLTDHLLFLLSTLIYDSFQFNKCELSNTTFLNFYFLKEKPHVFLYLPFNAFAAIPAYVMLLGLIFTWNFVDLLIIGISIGVVTRFQQFYKRLFDNHLAVNLIGSRFWTDLRFHFANLLELLHLIDNEMSYLILLSCGSNLFTICFQIFNSFKAIPHILRRINFWFTVFCLASRTFCSLYLASSINEMARKILNVLRDVPSKIWNADIQCMIDLLNGKRPIALTGHKFFILTRRMILAMVATIVTFELVIMEEAVYDAEDKPVCNTTRLNFIKNHY